VTVINTRVGPADLFDLRFIRDAKLCPDGIRVAYVVSRTDQEEHFEIWISDLSNGTRERLPYEGNAACPRWSCDGSLLAFVGDGRLRIVDNFSRDKFEPLTPETHSVQGPPTWSPDGRHVAVSLLELSKRAEGPRRITGRDFRADGLGFIDRRSLNIYIVDIPSAVPHLLTLNQGTCMQPDQDFPAYAQSDFSAGVRDKSWKANLFVSNIADKRSILNGGLGNPNPAAFEYIQPRTVGQYVSESF
jgi:dipeptidyl aminopeptidase/acylaminoacyl peptidase